MRKDRAMKACMSFGVKNLRILDLSAAVDLGELSGSHRFNREERVPRMPIGWEEGLVPESS